MAINKKLIHFKSKQKFNEELANGNILDTSIVFILDTTEIYTHGQYYGDLSECLTKYPQEFTKEEKDQMLENLGYYFIEWNGVSETMELSEEEYAKLNASTIPLLIAEGVIYYPNAFVPGFLVSFQMASSSLSAIVTIDLMSPPVLIVRTDMINIPSKTSDLENDSNFISSDNLKTINGESIIGEGDIIIPTKVSELENDANYILDDVVPDGVYAVDANGKLIDYHTADSSCIGVAFISANQKVMIAKADATDGTNTKLYWGKNLYGQDVPNLEYLTYDTAAKADYNGKANTAAIIAGYTTLGKDMDSRDMCKVLETYNESDYTDWYVPAAGQLYEFYSNKDALNEALAAISGTAFASDGYWSSSEESANLAWYVLFSDGDIRYSHKSSLTYVRFIRDISVKSLKERVSDLESKITQLNAVLVDTEEEADDPIVSEYITLTQLENKLLNKQDTLVSGTNIKTINGESILGEGNLIITTETNNYYTKEEIDTKIGDINTILESIINGESTTTKIITFLIGIREYQAEEGMTWEEWVNSDYDLGIFVVSYDNIHDMYGNSIILGSSTVLKNQVIIANEIYRTSENGQSGGSPN